MYEGREIAKMLRAMGLTPSFLELRPVTVGSKECFSFQEFLDLYVQYSQNPKDTMDSLTALLKAYDHQGDGTVDPDELQSALTSIGDTLTEEEVKGLLEAVGLQGGRLSIDALSKYLLA